MYRTAMNVVCLSAALVLSACNKQTEDTGSTDDSVASEDLPIDEPEDEGAEDTDAPDDGQEGGGDSSPGTEPPMTEEDGSEDTTDEESLEDDLTEDTDNGAYAGDMTIIINTSFGPDTCAGSASVDISEDGMMNGTNLQLRYSRCAKSSLSGTVIKTVPSPPPWTSVHLAPASPRLTDPRRQHTHRQLQRHR